MTRSVALRVGLLHFTAPPIVGGVEAILGRQALALAARGHRPLVLAGRGRLRRAGVDFLPIRALDSKYPPLLAINEELGRGEVTAAFEDLAAALEERLASVLADLDVCIVHNAMTLHFHLPLTVALHRIVGRGRGCGLVAWCHDLSWANPLYIPLMREAYPWVLLKTLARRTAYVLVSEDRRVTFSRLTGAAQADLAVIPAGVDLARKWAIGSATARLLREYRLLEADPFILLPARITRRKNVEYAIRVVAELSRRGMEPTLLVTGPRGPHDPASIRYVRELEELAIGLGVAERVILLQARAGPGGRTWRPTDPMMDELYRAADLMLFPSAQEGFGIPVLEAGAVNLPLFCSDIPSFREIAGTRAEYFDLDDPPAAVADRIVRFMAEDPRYGLRRQVKRRYAWDAIFDRQLIPLLRSIADETAGPRAAPVAAAGVGPA